MLDSDEPQRPPELGHRSHRAGTSGIAPCASARDGPACDRERAAVRPLSLGAASSAVGRAARAEVRMLGLAFRLVAELSPRLGFDVVAASALLWEGALRRSASESVACERSFLRHSALRALRGLAEAPCVALPHGSSPMHFLTLRWDCQLARFASAQSAPLPAFLQCTSSSHEPDLDDSCGENVRSQQQAYRMCSEVSSCVECPRLR